MRKILFVILTTAVVGMMGCEKEQNHVSCVKIVPDIRTRVTGLHFDEGDCIGLTITNGSNVYAENRKLVYDGTAFSASDLFWYNNRNEKSVLTAYYPYSEQGAPAEFTIAADQRGGCASSDLLAAVKKEVVPGSTPVEMLFYHLMSQLSILVTNKSETTVQEVSISGFVPVATVDFVASKATAKSGATAADVRAFEVTADALYRVILVPQQAALTVRVATADGKTHSKTVSTALLEGGMRYDLSVTLTATDIAVTLSGEINDWLDGGEIGDQSDESVTHEGQTYRTKRIDGRVWMAENLRHVPAGTSILKGVWHPVGGASAVAGTGLLYNQATALNGTVVTPGAPVQGICPPDWHIPDEDELTSLTESSECGEGFFSCAGFWIVNLGDERYGSANKGYLMSTAFSDGGGLCLSYTTSGAQPTIVSLPVEYGVSLRCVRDTK